MEDHRDEGAPAAPRQTRRGFLNWFLGTSFGAAAVAVFYPVVRYVNPPVIPEAEAARVLAGRVDDLPPNSGRVFPFGAAPAILVRTAEGEFRAFSATCTHLDCTVQFRPDLGQIWCACHNGTYDLSGQNVAGPPPRPLEAFTVKVLGDEVYISRKG